MRVAVAQTCPALGPKGEDGKAKWYATLETNLLDVRDWVEKASVEGADVIVFPEYFLQGLVDEGRQYLTFASRHLTDYLSRLAKDWDISIVGTIVHAAFDPSSSLSERLPTTSPFQHLPTRQADKIPNPDLAEWDKFIRQYSVGNHEPALHNTAVFIEGGSGKVLDEYQKRNLWHPERDYITPGAKEHQVFDTKWGRCGFLICWDVGHPGAAQILSDLGVDIVFAPTYWIGYDSAPIIHKHHSNPPKYESEVLSALSFSRSFETEAVWIMCNAGGPGKEGYIGGSGVWMPLKGKLGGVEGEGVGMVVVDVDLTVLKDARELYKIRADWAER